MGVPMFNTLDTTLSLLTTRRSGKARDMVAPGPDAVQLDQILAAAMRVPDHGKLAPWRFVIIDHAARDAFGAMLHAAYAQDRPAASRAERDAIEAFAHQAPVLVVLLSTPVQPHKIPLDEQRWSAGAAAMQLLNAAHAFGFVGNWLTGWASEHPAVRAALGATGVTDQIVGFFFIGTAAKPLEERPRPDPASVINHWTGETTR